MGAFIFDNSNSGGGGPFNMFRGEYEDAAKTTPIFQQMEYKDYVVAPKGPYTLKLTGFAEPVEAPIPEIYRREDGPTTKNETKLELEIVAGKGVGHKVLINYVTFSLGDRSNAFKIYVATICGGDKSKAPQLREWDSMLGKEFDAFLNVSDKRDEKTGKPIRNMMSWDSVSTPSSDDGDAYDPFADSDAIAS